jgi:hypothetical protein
MEEATKVTLCVLPTQYGKTFQAIKRIETEIEENDSTHGKSVHLVFTMNTLLGNKQFAKRLNRIEDKFGRGSVCVFTSKYNGDYIHVTNRDQLFANCVRKTKCPRVIIMCSNSFRFEDVQEFLIDLNENITNIKRVFVYYDELHMYISENLREQIEYIHTLEIVKWITAFTATPDNIWRPTGFWSKLRLLYLDEFNDTNYVGCRDMIFNTIDDFFENPYTRPHIFDFDELDKQTIEFIEHVLMKFPEIIQENTRTFIPAHKRRSSHNEVRDLIFRKNKNAVVVVLNGVEKTLSYKDKKGHTKTHEFTLQEEEVCEVIANLIIQQNLQSRPLVITGFLCVGMGQTLAHKLLGPFTSAIFGHLDLTNDDLSQLFGRICGRMKDWNNYVQTQVYCPTTVMHRCHVMEECARNMARRATGSENGDIITREDYREPMNAMGKVGKSAIENIRKVKTRVVKTKDNKVDINLYRIYDNEDTVKSVCKLLGYTYKPTKNNEEGFKETSLNKKAKVVSLQEAVKKVPTAYGTNKGEKTWRICYPCYVDKTDASTLRFVVILRPGTDTDKIAECDTKHPSIAFE